MRQGDSVSEAQRVRYSPRPRAVAAQADEPEIRRVHSKAEGRGAKVRSLRSGRGRSNLPLLALFVSLLWSRQALLAQVDYRLPTVSLGDTVLGVICRGLHLERPLRPRVGLALSGGGVRGLAQVGVLKAFDEAQIPVDVIAGASMGSIIGGLYASGLRPDEIWELARRVQWSEILQDRPAREQLFLGQKLERERHIIQFRLEESSLRPDIPLAFSPGQRLSVTLSSLAMRAPFGSLPNFDQYPIRLRIVATDLIHGQLITISSGDLAEAMRASASIPLLFSPVEWAGTMLVDGGLLDNIPVVETRAAGADLVIALDTTSPLRRLEELDLPWELVDQVTTIMQLRRNEEQLARADVAIRVPLPDQTAVEFRNLEQIYQTGYELGLQFVEEVRSRYQALEDSLIVRLWRLRPDSLLPVRHLFSDLPNRASAFPDTCAGLSVRDTYHLLAQLADSGYTDLSFRLLGDTLLIHGVAPPLLASIRCTGDSSLDSLLLPIAQKWEGGNLCYPRFRGLVEEMVRAFRGKNLSLARVDSASYDSSSGTLHLHVSPGLVTEVAVQGARRTRRFVILREFPIREGEYFDLRRAIEGISNIYSTGLFEWVGFSVQEDRGAYRVVVRVRERSHRVLRFGARYDLERRGKAFVEYADENLLGAANPLAVQGLYGVRDQGVYASYRIDRLFRSYLTSEARLQWETGRYFAYSGDRLSGEYHRRRSGVLFSFGQQMRRLGTVWLSVRWHRIVLQPIAGRGYPTGAYDLRTVGLRSVVDTRDRIPFARHGRRHEWFYEYSSGVFLTSEVSYTKFASLMESYTSWGRHTLHPRLAWGVSDLTTPFPEQYTLGGLDSFFGLREEQRRGRHFVCTSLEYRFALPWGIAAADWHFGIRLDWGAIWENNTSVRSKDLAYGLGGYLAADTVVGPLILGYGRTQHGSDCVYVSFGRSF